MHVSAHTKTQTTTELQKPQTRENSREEIGRGSVDSRDEKKRKMFLFSANSCETILRSKV